jgi:hexosaminidase
MKIVFIPEPKHVDIKDGALALPAVPSVGIASQELYSAACVIREFLPRASVNIAVAGVADTIKLSIDGRLRAGGYTLRITTKGIAIAGQSPAAVAHGVQTLRQIAEQSGRTLPHLAIRDWPDLADRGVYYDICRGRVPKLERLMEQADQLARYKVNQLQLYIEHTFAFRGHPNIGKGASPLTAEDILKLDEYCAARGIELVPSLATFGHLHPILRLPEYHHLAEDLGVGKLEALEDTRAAWQKRKAWSLSPAVPEVYEFLDSLFSEFLPLFRSKQFNICCDETFDLGLGQSYKLCQKHGKGKVYLEHICKVRDLAAKYGKTIMFWGDIIRHYPELIDEIPKDVLVLDWNYSGTHKFNTIKDFKEAGVPFYGCPGTSSWQSLFPRLPEAMANIHGFAKAAKRHGAQGLLNTDWGDGGHYNFMELSWHGYLFGAEQSWNVRADQETFTARFARLFLKCAEPALVKAIDELGRVAFVHSAWLYQGLWQHAFFAPAGDELFRLMRDTDTLEFVDGKVRKTTGPLEAALGKRYLKRIEKVRATLARYAGKRGIDPQGILPYWLFATDTMVCATRKLAVLAPGGTDTPAARRALKREMTALMKRFEKLWMARNRRSEIRITLARYRRAIKSLH